MKKEFKLKPGDGVWFMYDDKPTFGKITKGWYRRSISCVDFETISEVENYRVAIGENELHDTFELKDLFPDKESLIKSL